MANFDETIDVEACAMFPTGFLGSKVTGAALVWEQYADNIEDFARDVVYGLLPDNDYAEETTIIDMQNRRITQKAEYIIGGSYPEEWDGYEDKQVIIHSDGVYWSV